MRIIHTLAVASALLTAQAASAAIVFSLAGPTAATTIPGSFTYNFNASATTAALTFTINGYDSVDGSGNFPFDDTFTLTLNGTDIMSGAYSMGGGYGAVTYFSPAGTTTFTVDNGLFQGGYTDVATTLALVSGNNTLTFSYNNYNPQGLGDESWGLSDISVSAVPEPANWAMLIAGFGLVGAAARRRRMVVAA